MGSQSISKESNHETPILPKKKISKRRKVIVELSSFSYFLI